VLCFSYLREVFQGHPSLRDFVVGFVRFVFIMPMCIFHVGRVYATEQDYLFAWLRLFHRLQFSCAGSWFVAKVSTARLGFYIQRPGGVCFVVCEGSSFTVKLLFA
jgi:hypothetical protein